MAADAEKALQLAWQADRDGRPGRRDALLTLALALAGPEDRDWIERCRRRLFSSHPDHILAASPDCETALRDPRVAGAIERLRQTFPPERLDSLLRRHAAACGPYNGRPGPRTAVLEDLFGPILPPGARPDAPASLFVPSTRRVHAPMAAAVLVEGARRQATAALPAQDEEAPAAGSSHLHEELKSTYMAVLLAIAMLLDDELHPPSR